MAQQIPLAFIVHVAFYWCPFLPVFAHTTKGAVFFSFGNTKNVIAAEALP